MDDLAKIEREIRCKYAGLSIDEIIAGTIVETPYGFYYLCKSELDIPWFSFPSISKLKALFLERLDLVFGIRRRLWDRLLKYGVKRLEELINVPRFRSRASFVLSALESGSIGELAQLMQNRLPSGDKLNLILPALLEKESIVFFDIETESLSINTNIVLLGLGYFVGDSFCLYQYLSLSRKKSEKAIISSFFKELSKAKLLISFCGKRFDLPVLQARLSYYGFKELDIPHLDLYDICKRNLALNIPDCRLKTIEKCILGLKRDNDIPSEFVPYFYRAYEATGNCGYLKYIVEHNKEDILSLVRIFSFVSRY